MPDAHDVALTRAEITQTSEAFTTPGFDVALVDAGLLLEHAASNGLLPEKSDAAEAMIRDVIQAQDAALSARLTPHIVIAFWIAYGRLAHLVRPVTARFSRLDS